MLMSLSRCTARHSGACRCAPIDFAYPRGSRFQPKQGSDSSRRARDTAATMLHFTHFWRHRGESAMKHCQLYNCTCKKCVYMNISDKNWPNNVEFRGNFHRFAPSTAGRQEIILTVELSNPKSTRATDWQIYATCIICVCSQNCGLLSTHNLLIIHMNEYTCTEFLWHFFHASNLMPKLWGQNHARISPMLATSARFQSGFGTLWHVITYKILDTTVWCTSAVRLLMDHHHRHHDHLSRLPWIFLGSHWKPMGLREISRVIWQLWSQWHRSQYNKLLLSIKYGMHHQHALYLLHQ